MNKLNLLKIIAQGENISVEFKKSHRKLNRDVYDTICSFSNRIGGDLFLGVDDLGNICGIDPDEIENVKHDLVTSLNNSQKIIPPLYLIPEQYENNGRLFLYLNIPESSQVHKHNNKIFDRNEDGDFDITNSTDLVANMYLRKQASYSENRIFPFVTMYDLRPELIHRARKLAENQRPGHAWNELSDIEMLKSAQLFHRNFQTGEEGFTLACILLFGKDETILSVLPHYKTDAILRQKNLDRYDDRDIVQTNLIESYDRLMAFVAKHLPDKFYLDGNQRISLRDHIFREVICNILIHREFINPYPAKLVIEAKEVITENSNNPHGYGLIDFNKFSPFPKNPTIARVFREIGRAEELGSGIRNLNKFCKEYSGKSAQLIEADIFKTVIVVSPAIDTAIDTVIDTVIVSKTEKMIDNAINTAIKDSVSKKVRIRFNKIIILISDKPGLRSNEIANILNVSEITIRRDMQKLKQLIEFKGVSTQIGGYYLTAKMKEKMDKIKNKQFM